ncbi:hypothetical protein [Alkalimonas sp.]|uniref:hypothetical protein n=1 Tax=Alkalimonas sp. TaxID=1872453 RepID=UPI00263BDCD5|nr:hypothetical protein [Alkalimonas sp.]MCC5825743.1 hypothetical protein [Alkalimonas sp.]
MTNVISILEKMGQATCFENDKLAIEHELVKEQSSEIIQALRAGNVELLNQILNVRAQLICGIHPAEDPDKEDKKKEDDEEEKEEEKQSNSVQLNGAGAQLRYVG